jgi:hypothetical protein
MSNFLIVPTYLKVNWYEEELDKFYETDKDNNGYVHGIYLYYGDEPFDYECQWFKTKQERDKKFNEIQKEESYNE